MLEQFELWYQTNKEALSDDAKGLFADSIKCFKNDVDRPAYLLAYQGMMCTIKHVVMHGQRPAAISEGEWRSILRNLSTDSAWDEEAYKCATRREDPGTGKHAILTIPDDVRSKFDYWRQLRNTCAHYKGYHFIKAHTLTLYAFIEQYLMRITVEGGMMTLVHEFEVYYDPAKTSEHEPIEPLINKIKTMVQPDEYATFLTEVRRIHGRYHARDFQTFLHQAWQCGKQDFKGAIKGYLFADKDLRARYLEAYPDQVVYMLTEKNDIHEFWYRRLPASRQSLHILPHMLAAGMISDADKPQVYDAIQTYLYRYDYHCYDLQDFEVKELRVHGYFQYFFNKYLPPSFVNDSSKFREICYRTNFYMSHLCNLPVDKALVERIIEVFTHANPYTLHDRYRDELVLGDAEYRAALDKVCADNGLILPESLTAKA